MNLDERLQKDLSPDMYCLVHNKMVNLEQQVKKQKEIIDKVKLIIKGTAYGGNEDYYMEKINEINELLKEVSE